MTEQSGATVSAGDVLAMLTDAYAEIKRVRRSLRREDDLMRDLNADSLVLVEMLVLVEDRTGVALLAEERLAGLRSVGEMCDAIAECVNQELAAG